MWLVNYLLEVNEQPFVDSFRLDLEYEVKGRNYTTSGTVGQKILKRSKPIYIVLVGYQECEGDKNFNLFSATGAQSTLLKIYESVLNDYIKPI